MRVIGIIGRRYSGSTLLSHLFKVKNSISPGELHWIIDAPRKSIGRCRSCGNACPVFTPSLRASTFESDLYTAVARSARVECLVSSDKTPWQYDRFVKPGEMDGIILFRHPLGSAASDLRRKVYHNPTSVAASAWAARGWLDFHHGLKQWAESFCRNVVHLSYEALVRDVDSALGALHEALGTDPSTKNHSKHYIGGGTGHKHGTIKPDTRWQNELTSDQIKLINNSYATALYEKMAKLSVV